MRRREYEQKEVEEMVKEKLQTIINQKRDFKYADDVKKTSGVNTMARKITSTTRAIVKGK